MGERRRLTDDEVTRIYSGDGPENVEEAANTLEADHLQAREDVKRLVVRLRALTPTGSGHDRECVGHYAGTMPPGCDCKTGQLLAEVDPK